MKFVRLPLANVVPPQHYILSPTSIVARPRGPSPAALSALSVPPSISFIGVTRSGDLEEIIARDGAYHSRKIITLPSDSGIDLEQSIVLHVSPDGALLAIGNFCPLFIVAVSLFSDVDQFE